jgi:DNA-binding NarL/FixJ family response regulator
VLKTAELPQLYHALLEVAVGRTAFDPGVLEKASRNPEDAGTLIEDLTDREIEVLVKAAYGLTNKQIGTLLFISDRTVQGHLQNIYQKLGARTRTEAVTVALARGLIALEDGT